MAVFEQFKEIMSHMVGLTDVIHRLEHDVKTMDKSFAQVAQHIEEFTARSTAAVERLQVQVDALSRQIDAIPSQNKEILSALESVTHASDTVVRSLQSMHRLSAIQGAIDPDDLQYHAERLADVADFLRNNTELADRLTRIQSRIDPHVPANALTVDPTHETPQEDQHQ